MKNIKKTALFILLVLASCKKSENSTDNQLSANSAGMVATALSANSNGIASLSVDLITNGQYMADFNLGCGSIKSLTTTHQSANGAASTFNYAVQYSYFSNCNSNNQLDNVTGGGTDTGTFEGSGMSASGTGTGTLNVAGLTNAAANYTISGTYKRSGIFTSKIGDKIASYVTITLITTNIVINKATKVITSGTANVSIVGNDSVNNKLNLTGNVVFNGNGQATFTVNSDVYVIDLVTGDYRK